MQLYEFIFSTQKTHRVTRHLVFWIVFSIGFYLQSIVPMPNMYFSAFLSLCFFLPTVILATYLLLYIFLPRFLQQQLYIKFTASFLLLALSCYVINYFTASIFVSIACNCPGSSIPVSQKLGFAFLNTTHALTIGGLALAIKFTKNWYLQQKENLQLAKQKISNELQLQKGSIYPGFLFRSLDNLYSKITSNSSDSSSLLLKLSDQLSYILYDSREEYISLEKELSMLKNRLEIEKINRSGNLNIQVKVSGDPSHKEIVPMTLFLMVENFLKAADLKKTKTLLVDLNIEIEQRELSLRLVFDQPEIIKGIIIDWQELLTLTRARLEILYPEGFKLELTKENNAMVISQVVFLKSGSTADTTVYPEKEVKFKIYENS
jgi:sensor histidine kinase YesM